MMLLFQQRIVLAICAVVLCSTVHADDAPVVLHLNSSSKSVRVEVAISSVSEYRFLDLYFETCVSCGYRWKLKSNSYTKRIKAYHKELISNKNGLLGGQDTVLYRFKAFNSGKATLPYEYGPVYPAPKNATFRVTVHVTITKSLTPVPIITKALIPTFTTTPSPSLIEFIPRLTTTSVAIVPASTPAETGPVLDPSMQAASYMVMLGQKFNLSIPTCKICEEDKWVLYSPQLSGVLKEYPMIYLPPATDGSTPGKSVFTFEAVGLGIAELPFLYTGDLGGLSLFIVSITVVSDYADGVPQLPPATPT
uniref:Uncharacterized protein n=1 Tax=Cryptomonas curvata TaxID=233186 RepID=A0A7S0N1L0_9CRYP|mmetsp:Transcript_59620/g.124550  ORF Transcript_59620/g.124550 Transcript_59620/m.124550 type:complete len:307 (+) Transcript_59620:127-1047(+)